MHPTKNLLQAHGQLRSTSPQECTRRADQIQILYGAHLDCASQPTLHAATLGVRLLPSSRACVGVGKQKVKGNSKDPDTPTVNGGGGGDADEDEDGDADGMTGAGTALQVGFSSHGRFFDHTLISDPVLGDLKRYTRINRMRLESCYIPARRRAAVRGHPPVHFRG